MAVMRIMNLDVGRRALIWCPACEEAHALTIDREGSWGWDGNLEQPTFSPSLLVLGGRQGPDHRCHSFIENGNWRYLEDSTHAFARQIVPVPDLPDWLEARDG